MTILRAVALSVLVLAPASLYAKCAPKHVLKIVVAVADHPRTIYRSGERMGRVEQETMLFVVNEPDIWVVNRNDMTGQHMIDEGPELVFGAPILDNIESKYWNNFEFGCEVPFMEAVGSEPVPTEDGGRLYEHTAEGVTAKLFVHKNGLPRRVELSGKHTPIALDYRSFEELRDAPPDLFTKPTGVKFVEANETPSDPER
jgi:hypothetical protein